MGQGDGMVVVVAGECLSSVTEQVISLAGRGRERRLGVIRVWRRRLPGLLTQRIYLLAFRGGEVLARLEGVQKRFGLGGSTSTLPRGSWPRIEARSKRKPSTCISPTQKCRHVRMRLRTTG